MDTHIRGVALLILLVAALWGAVKLAGPVFDEAFGDEGAIIARSPDDDSDSLRIGEAPENTEAPLTFDEISTLQWLLGVEGFLDPDSDVDGLLGPITEAAIVRAKATFAIPTASDRILLSLLEGRNTDLFGTIVSAEAAPVQ
ncbi:MAG: hypothetical protein OXF75_07995 [Acidimicrobiaceae bacterium]|nr:hypothetical protein [Acidimicrobiaceae bacterium]